MFELIHEWRHFLKLFVQTSSTQRKGLLQTITKRQLRALSQIGHNCITFRIKLNPTEKALLKRERRLLYILGDITFGYKRKKETNRGKQRFVYNLLKIALTYLDLFGTLATIMENMVLVPYDKYQRMLEA